MKKKTRNFILILCAFAFSFSTVFAQDIEWKDDVSKDGKTKIVKRFYEETDQSGNTHQIIHYKAFILTNVAFEKLVAVLGDPSTHKIFLQNTIESKIVKTISENEYLIYYVYKAPWPLPESDCATLMKKTTSTEGKEIEFRGIASPKLYEDKGVKRLTLNDVVYTVKKLDNNQVRLSIESKFIPVVKAPNWMVDTWFPEGPSGLFERVIELADKIKI